MKKQEILDKLNVVDYDGMNEKVNLNTIVLLLKLIIRILADKLGD